MSDLPENQLEAPAAPAPRRWTPLSALLMLIGMFAAQAVAGLVLGLVLMTLRRTGSWDLADTWQQPMILVASTVPTLLLLLWQRRRAGVRRLWAWAELLDRRGWAALGWTLMISLGANMLRGMLTPDPQVPDLNQGVLHLMQSASGFPWVPMLVTLLCMVVLAPLAEEWLFRGIIQQALADRWGPWVAIPVTAVVFGLFHGLDLWWVAAIYGLAFGFIAHRRGSLTFSLLAHGCLNLGVFLLLVSAAGR